MSTPDPRVFIQDIQTNLKLVENFTQGYSYEDFCKDIKLQYAVIRCFEVIGEAARRVPEDFRQKYPAFPWRVMAGMRDKLIHGYDTVDPSIVWGTVTSDVPRTLVLIEEIQKSFS
jgi:hypothetical protein